MLPLTVLLGTFEGIYGRVRYSGDAINYLNIVRAIHDGDWRLAFNSYWGLGYPLLISAITPIFPATPYGEWIAIHTLNLSILIATFFCFFALVKTIAGSTFFAEKLHSTDQLRFVWIGVFAIFVSIELSMDNVSRVGPDMLVTCLIFLAANFLLRLQQSPKVSSAITLGLILGIGYVVKAIFLPLIVIFAVVLLLACWKKREGFRATALMLVASAIFALPYIAGMSWAAGRFTYGDAGPLNYAWNVNKLEPGGLWQGDLPEYGKPVHPAQRVLQNPRIYIFDGPFPVTFAPFFNPPWYYQGYRHFFHPRAQLREFAGNVLRLIRILRVQFVIYAFLLCWILSKVKRRIYQQAIGISRHLGPLIAVAAAGTLLYLLVFVEARYIASFVAIVLLIFLFSIASEEANGLSIKTIYVAIALAGSATTLAVTQRDSDRDVIGHALHHHLFNNDEQWIAANYLSHAGALPGDKVAVMADLVSATRSSWAYYDRLRIVGLLGGSLVESQTMDFDVFWQASPDRQRQILSNFQSVGVKFILSTSKPAHSGALGWEPIPDTSFWVYRF